MKPRNILLRITTLKKVLQFLSIFICLTCQSTGERTVEGNGKIDKLEIRGFTQFPIYTSRDFLGYISAEGQEKTFDKKIWKGKIKKDPIQQSITISYSKEDLKEIKGGFSDVLSAEAGYETIQSMNLILENPVQYILEDISLESTIQTNKDVLKRPYIGAVLKVDKIKIEFKNKDGSPLKQKQTLK